MPAPIPAIVVGTGFGCRIHVPALRAAGFEVGDVTHVVLTHLHFDHCGWNTRLDGAGNAVATFPKARYFMNWGDTAPTRLPTERDTLTLLAAHPVLLIEAGKVKQMQAFFGPGNMHG